MTLYLGVLINESHKWDLGLAVFDIFRSFGEYYRFRTIEFFGESKFSGNHILTTHLLETYRFLHRFT